MKSLAEQFDLPHGVAAALRFARNLLISLAFLAVVLVVLEAIAFHFFPGRSARVLVERRINDQAVWTDNPFFSYRFFPARTAPSSLPIVAAQSPTNDSLRVCLLGGSAALGMPEPAFGVGRQLERMLEHRYPGREVDVFPLALDGANSHVLREAARDLKRLRPQAVIVLTGNDEIAGPYGPASRLGRFHHSARIARLMTLFSRTRLSQLLAAGLDRLFPARADLNAWRSQEPFSLRGRMAPDDPRLKTAYRSFRKNLAAILAAAGDASPVVIACTVPVNLRDCAPFATSYAKDETTAQQVRETLRDAMDAESSTNLYEAARLYSDAIRANPHHAEALFRAARLALAERRPAEATALFSQARDADALRLRADSQINAIIRQCATATSASLLDAEALFAHHASGGIPGRELFLDHIHFTFDGHYLLATALLHRMEHLHAFDPAAPSLPVPDRQDMAGAMLYRPWGRVSELETIVRQQLRPPFRRQLTNADTLADLRAELQRARDRRANFSPESTRAIFARQQALHPGDAWLAARAAWHLLQADDPARAESAAGVAFARWPHRFDIRALLALIRAFQGEAAEAGIAFLRGDRADTGYYDIHHAIGIGRVLHEHKRYDQARFWLEYAIERDPWNSEGIIALAETLYQLNDSEQATTLLRDALERNPGNPLLWEQLAVLYTLLGDWRKANECYSKSEEIAPYRYERLLKWAEAMVRLWQHARAKPLVERYLKMMPNDPEALALQDVILTNLPAKMDAPPDTPPPPAEPRLPWQ